MKEVKEEERLLNENKQEMLRHYKQLKKAENIGDMDPDNVRRNAILLNTLFEEGIIDQGGNIFARHP